MTGLGLRRVLVLAIILFLLHGLEECATGMFSVDPIFMRLGGYAPLVLIGEMAAIAGLFIALLSRSVGSKIRRILLWVALFLSAFELDHLEHALRRHGYYPGVVTAIPIVLLGVFFGMVLYRRVAS